MLPGNGIGDVDKTCYTTNDNYKFKYGSEGLNTSDIKEYIRNPHKFNIKLEMDGQYLNLWSTDNERTDANDDVVIKSVYDPSPVGYSIPASNAFTGFTSTGEQAGNPWVTTPTTEEVAKFNVKGGFDKGWYFYRKPNRQGETFFFPAAGIRSHADGKMYYTSLYGYYWAQPGDNHYGRYLRFGFNFIQPLDNYFRSYGMTVRSAEERRRCVS